MIPSLSQSFVASAFGFGSHGFNGSLPPSTSSPSFTPSPSVSGLFGSVPIGNSSAFVNPSLSQSFVASAFGFGSHGFNGSLPPFTSSPSLIPSPSVSGLFGSVPIGPSSTLVIPSLSQSFVASAFGFGSHGFKGSLPPVTSSPSLIPSPSVSGLFGSVPIGNSSAFVNPSLSQSFVASAFGFGSHGFNGSLPPFTSSPSLIPSPSVSGLFGSVPIGPSSTFVIPSLSQSFVASAFGSGSHGFNGSLPPSTSSPSFTPSLSESGSDGLVPFTPSSPLFNPSLSQSANRSKRSQESTVIKMVSFTHCTGSGVPSSQI